jgi:hypothetical protein
LLWRGQSTIPTKCKYKGRKIYIIFINLVYFRVQKICLLTLYIFRFLSVSRALKVGCFLLYWCKIVSANT